MICVKTYNHFFDEKNSNTTWLNKPYYHIVNQFFLFFIFFGIVYNKIYKHLIKFIKKL